jgi:hypothetical protein
MFDMVSGMFCFITMAISFLYGTRVCWVCGKDCSFDVDPGEKKQILKQRIPAGFAIYSFGFFVLFSFILDGVLTIMVTSLISSLILSHFVVSMSMPSLKRNPSL